MFPKSLDDTVLQLQSATKAYDEAWRINFNKIKILPMPRFWEMVVLFRQEVVRRLGPKFDSRKAVDEFFRIPQAADHTAVWDGRQWLKSKSPYTFEEAVQFARTWEEVKGPLYDKLFNIIEGKGDDSYGDLLDALPLAGQKFYERCLAGKFYNCDDFIELLKAEDDKLFDTIYEGENYFEMFLEEEAKRRYVFEVEDKVVADVQ